MSCDVTTKVHNERIHDITQYGVVLYFKTFLLRMAISTVMPALTVAFSDALPLEGNLE